MIAATAFQSAAASAIPIIGRTLSILLGSSTTPVSTDDLAHATALNPPETFDRLLRFAEFASPLTTSGVSDTPWVCRALSADSLSRLVCPVRRYKPVARKVKPVSTTMPDLSAQAFKPLEIPETIPLPTSPPPYDALPFDDRMTRERLDIILATIPDGFLSPEEINLIAFVILDRRLAVAFTDHERGIFSRLWFPDYKIPVIEHVPWQQAPIPIPFASRSRVTDILNNALTSGKYEPGCSSYRSRVFPVAKKSPGDLRLVHDLQQLNSITIRDAMLPPRPDDFAESFAGYVIYGVADLFSGYDARTLDVSSRDLTTFQCMDISARCTVLPQGATNAVADFVRCTKHMLAREIPKHADVFLDDCGMKGPRTDYDDEPIPDNPRIRRFVYEYAGTLDRVLLTCITAGATVSGYKFLPAVPRVGLIGSEADRNGWWLSKGVATKVERFPYPENVTEVRAFLGIAGVARKWILGFSLIAKPLTELCRHSDDAFSFSDAARAAVDELKRRITSAPVLRSVDYDLALTIHPPLNGQPEGLIVVGVDSSYNGAGWVLSQYHGSDRHPARFGSCTFSATESRYSQPKCELYGVFRALKELRHRVWGVHFRLEVDAKFLEQMIREPDLPNAPMTRWVSYLQLFDFTLVHIPADKGRAQDALSRRPRQPDDSDESDGEEHLMEMFGRQATYTSVPRSAIIAALHLDMRTSTASWGRDLLPPSLSGTPTLVHEGVFALAHDSCDLREPTASMLRSRLTTFYCTGFHRRHLSREGVCEFLLGDELVTLAFTDSFADGLDSQYESSRDPCAPPAWSGSGSSTLMSTDPWWLPAVPSPFPGPGGVSVPPARDTLAILAQQPAPVAAPSHLHIHDVPQAEPDWTAITAYLEHGTLPAYLPADSIRQFRQFAARFFVLEGRLWRDQRNRTPQLVILDPARRQEILAQVHDTTGHRGRDTTYLAVRDRYWWPNLYRSAHWFVASCQNCQFHSRYRSVPPLTRSLCPFVLRRIHVDTIHMPDKAYLLHASCATSQWPEARYSKTNTSDVWARFLFEDVICRFGCIPVLVCDNGSEFKGAAKELLRRYQIAVVITSPYNAKANGIAERHGQTLGRAIIRLCPPGKPKAWRRYLHAGLLAVRTTVSRATGYTPYFLLYGMHCLFPFDLTDRTWYALDWDEVTSTEDLLTLRIAQLTRHDDDVSRARANLDASRQRAVDDFNRRHHDRLRAREFEPGTWVLLHETWLDAQHGNKGALRWAGPYVVALRYPNGSYRLRELDGSLMKSSAPGSRLRLFYFRDTHQTPVTRFARFLTASESMVWDEEDLGHFQASCNLVSTSLAMAYDDDAFLDTFTYPVPEPGLERFPQRLQISEEYHTNVAELRKLQSSLSSVTIN